MFYSEAGRQLFLKQQQNKIKLKKLKKSRKWQLRSSPARLAPLASAEPAERGLPTSFQSNFRDGRVTQGKVGFTQESSKFSLHQLKPVEKNPAKIRHQNDSSAAAP